MKLFVWEDTLTDYTSGIMVAVATDVEQARKQLLEVCSYIPDKDLGNSPDVYELDDPVAFAVWGGG